MAAPRRSLRRDRGAVLATGAGFGLSLESTLPDDNGDPGAPQSFTVAAGERVGFVLEPRAVRSSMAVAQRAEAAERDTSSFWSGWSADCTYRGPYRDAVIRSLITMKALIYAPSGGVAAAATTSLPEQPGGSRNWDYRFCWLRDATFALLAMLHGGYRNEALAWSRWLMRALGDASADTQPVYGICGERHLEESEAGWLPGFNGARPVRFGNNAFKQFQLDLYGEVFDTLHQMRNVGERLPDDAWVIQRRLLEQVCARWREPDAGIWEQRNDPKYFTQSRVMAWVALDAGIATVERYGYPGPVEEWRRTRQAIHDDVCEKGFDQRLGAFTRSYGSGTLDAATLLIPMVGFLPPDDPRVLGTTEAIARDLTRDGFVLRYSQDKTDDGLEDEEGTFLPCSFWLADNWILQGRRDEAVELFERLLGVANDLGLLSEEYEPDGQMLLGNFPQLLTHLSLVHTAYNLTGEGPVHHRSRARQKGFGHAKS